MSIQTREEKYSKELDDVLVLIVQLVKQARAGKPLEEIVSSSLPLLVQAIAGIDEVGSEISVNFEIALSTIGGRVGEVAAALLQKPVVPVA